MSSLQAKIFGGALVALSLFVFPGFADEIRVPKAVLFIFFTGVVFSWFLAKRLAPEFGVFFLFVTSSAVLSGFAKQFQMVEWVFIGCALGSAILVARLPWILMQIVLKSIGLAALLNCLYAYVQIAGYDRIFVYTSKEVERIPVGFLGQQTLLGPMLAAGLTVALFYRVWWAAFVFLPVLYVSGSSFTYLSVAAGVFLWLSYEVGFKRVLFIPLLGVALLAFLVKMKSDLVNPQGRLEVWQGILRKTFQESPLFGHGVGTYKVFFQEVQSLASMRVNGMYREAHSDLMQFFFDGGLTGIFVVGLVLFFFVRQAMKHWAVREVACAASVAAAILANACGNFPLRLVPQGLVCLFSIVMVSTYQRKVVLE